MNWTTEKPVFTEECTLVTASYFKDHWEYILWEIKKIESELGWYLGLCTSEGEEWGTFDEMVADRYLILSKIE